MHFPFLKYSKIYFIFSGILIIASIITITAYGLNWGVDFAGGSILKAVYSHPKPEIQELSDRISELGLSGFSIRFSGENEIIIRMPEVSQDIKDEVSSVFYNMENIEEGSISFESVSPVIGEESKTRASKAIIFSIIAIVVYVAFAFRKISRPVKSWQYGIATVVALVHDVLIPVGVFAILGKFWGVEFSIPILTALLTILGYSVNDTVVVFDRIRENLIKGVGETFNDIIDKSLNQTLGRSFNTVFTTLLALFAIFFFGGQSLTYFSLALILGISLGAYSSIFLASTLIAQIYYFNQRKFR
ncbi:protein translocase subunit SecF [Patescibacteria group bacterium]|nr:protein translocase subunit SecF [Patescibacteria group bacterium]MBU4078167.1 protein translocase subunit SecF [Patescibacteria group bacterium]MBU4161992.1 protein translocase subunit SecF [Patescibacteria group bacterium]